STSVPTPASLRIAMSRSALRAPWPTVKIRPPPCALERQDEGRQLGDPHAVELAGVDLCGPLYHARMEQRRAQHRLDLHARGSVDTNLCSHDPQFGARLQTHVRVLDLHDSLQIRQLLLKLRDPVF